MAKNEIARITCEELKAVLDEAAPVVIVDTRPRGSYSGRHIPGAINIPYNPAADPMERDMMLGLLPGDRLTVLYCDWLDDGISASMAQELLDRRFDADKVRALAGGISRWFELGYELT